MRLKLVTATSLLALGLFTTAQGVEINQDGANAVRDNLTKFLPEELAKSGLITVNPAGGRYEIIYDLAKLLAKVDPATFTITGLVPFSTFATPLDSGLWNIEGNNSLNVSGHFKGPEDKPTEFTYSISSLVYKGVFDPAISYLRSGTSTAKDIKVTSKSDMEDISASFAGMDYTLNSTDSAAGDGRIDFVASGSMSTFSERVSSQQMPPIDISADSLDFEGKVDKLPATKIRDIVMFVLDHADEKQISPDSTNKLKALLKETFPLFGSFSETIGVNNLAVTSQVGSGGAKAFGYNFAVDGPSDAVRFGFGMNADQISFDSPLVPAIYSTFVPASLDLQFAVPDMDFAAFSDEFMAMDFNTTTPESSGEKAAEKLFRNGQITIDFPKISAKSDVYDIDMNGSIKGQVGSEKDYSMEATVFARDLDKTIAAVQELAKTDPDLNQVSFGIMMVKGFAKTDPDGRSRWDISISRDGSISVNGQVMKGADQP